MSETDAMAEADRLMRICNACRYCEGLCAVFPALERRRVFAAGDLNYLANLCHQCGACFHDCQYAPPHEFAVNVPRALAQVRAASYAAYAWPRALAPLFERNGLAVALIAALSVALFVGGFAAWSAPEVMFAASAEPGAFYRIMPHNAMVALFGGSFLYALVALWMGFRAFWRDVRPAPTVDAPSIWQAVRDAGRLRYLDGGGAGCMNESDAPTDTRKRYHHATFYGFLLCFAATCSATLMHYLLGWEAPYAWYSLAVVLGTVGGIGLVIGPAGLIAAKRRRDPEIADTAPSAGMDVAFLAMLLAVSLTGLLLLVLRATPAMGSLLAIHLGFVFAFFLTMPYGKFVHGLYRFGALVVSAMESRSERA